MTLPASTDILEKLSRTQHEYERLQEVLSRLAALRQWDGLLATEQAALKSDLEEAKDFVHRKHQIALRFQQSLLMRLQQSSVGLFSDLLSALIRDLFPGDHEKRPQIALELYTYLNQPALRIEPVVEGFTEDFRNTGGSVRQIVSIGLRMIALSRSPNRKFMVLDEQDAWLSESKVEPFARLLGELSKHLGVQTVLISHKQWRHYAAHGRVIEFSRPDARTPIEAVILHDTPVESASAPESIISDVWLQNVGHHENTHVKLHPHLTCITGANNLGKSIFISACSALFFNDASDSIITHHKDFGQVVARIKTKAKTQNLDTSETSNSEPPRFWTHTHVAWRRMPKKGRGAPSKVIYSLAEGPVDTQAADFDEDSLHLPVVTRQHEEIDGSNTPKFIEDALNIRMSAMFDLHIHHQDQALFILSPEYKPGQKAQILSLGQEASLINKNMELLQQDLRSARAKINHGEPRFDQVGRLREINQASLAHLEPMKAQLQALGGQVQRLKSLAELAKHTQKLKDTNLRLESVSSLAASASAWLNHGGTMARVGTLHTKIMAAAALDRALKQPALRWRLPVAEHIADRAPEVKALTQQTQKATFALQHLAAGVKTAKVLGRLKSAAKLIEQTRPDDLTQTSLAQDLKRVGTTQDVLSKIPPLQKMSDALARHGRRRAMQCEVLSRMGWNSLDNTGVEDPMAHLASILKSQAGSKSSQAAPSLQGEALRTMQQVQSLGALLKAMRRLPSPQTMAAMGRVAQSLAHLESLPKPVDQATLKNHGSLVAQLGRRLGTAEKLKQRAALMSPLEALKEKTLTVQKALRPGGSARELKAKAARNMEVASVLVAQTQKINASRDQATSAQDALNRANAALNAWRKEHPVCPLCQHTWSDDHGAHPVGEVVL